MFTRCRRQSCYFLSMASSSSSVRHVRRILAQVRRLVGAAALSSAAWSADSTPTKADAPSTSQSSAQTFEFGLKHATMRGSMSQKRPVGSAELGLGWLTLPRADVCADRGDTIACIQGDTSLQFDIWPLYRPVTRIAFGAGITLGLVPTTGAPRQDPPGLQRDHQRAYFTAEGTIRYYPYVAESQEFWLGLTSGLVVLRDSFTTQGGLKDLAFVGQQGVTIRTEGFAVGMALGMNFSLSPRWTLGGKFRYGNWYLPDSPSRDVFGDQASLTGRNSVFSLDLVLGYRTPL